ncbi:MAG: hypothetical protein FJ299_07540 [Planctomycetes bacterium]|nr:hypothetical protein [Planctomycetota bacterium]
MRRLRIARGARDLDAREAGRGEAVAQRLLGEAEMLVLVLLAHPLLVVGEQVEHEHLAAAHEDAARLLQRAHRDDGMVQRLRQHGHVEGLIGQR